VSLWQEDEDPLGLDEVKGFLMEEWCTEREYLQEEEGK